MARSYHFECEIRGTNTYESHSMADEADVNVLTDELHPNGIQQFGTIAVYLADDHDQSVDVTVQASHPGDGVFTYASDMGSATLAAGEDGAVIAVDGPVGRLQFTATTSTAPTSGSLLVHVLATGD